MCWGVGGGEERCEVWGNLGEVWGSALGCGGGDKSYGERFGGGMGMYGGGMGVFRHVGIGVGKCVGMWGEVRKDMERGVGEV